MMVMLMMMMIIIIIIIITLINAQLERICKSVLKIINEYMSYCSVFLQACINFKLYCSYEERTR